MGAGRRLRAAVGRLLWRARLRRALPPAVAAVWAALEPAWLVGGSVRDL